MSLCNLGLMILSHGRLLRLDDGMAEVRLMESAVSSTNSSCIVTPQVFYISGMTLCSSDIHNMHSNKYRIAAIKQNYFWISGLDLHF